MHKLVSNSIRWNVNFERDAHAWYSINTRDVYAVTRGESGGCRKTRYIDQSRQARQKIQQKRYESICGKYAVNHSFQYAHKYKLDVHCKNRLFVKSKRLFPILMFRIKHNHRASSTGQSHDSFRVRSMRKDWSVHHNLLDVMMYTIFSPDYVNRWNRI